jgi:hypothetical protein
MSTRCTGSCMPGCRRAPRRPNRGPPQVWPIAYRSFTRESVRVALREMASRKRPDVVGADLGAFEVDLEAGALVASAWRRRVAARRGALRRGWGVAARQLGVSPAAAAAAVSPQHACGCTRWNPMSAPRVRAARGGGRDDSRVRNRAVTGRTWDRRRSDGSSGGCDSHRPGLARPELPLSASPTGEPE